MPKSSEINLIPTGYQRLEGSERDAAPKARLLDLAGANEIVTVTLIVRRRPDGPPLRDFDYFQRVPPSARKILSNREFEETYGAAQEDLDSVVEFARAHALEIVESHRGRRSVVVRGTATQMNVAFAVTLYQYELPGGSYRGYEGFVYLPTSLSGIVETVIGLDIRPVPARHYSVDPATTNSLTPPLVAQLYNFPAGAGAGQTIGIYEMATSAGNPGYTQGDIDLTMFGFGSGLNFGTTLTAPTPTDVSIDGQKNAGVSDAESLLDITVASAIANEAAIVVYFTSDSVQGIIHALQRMILPGPNDPHLNVISISYGWAPDGDTSYISSNEYAQISQLFGVAASLGITVLVATGDSGVTYSSGSQAQAGYPATDPWVLACGGTTVGDINFNGLSFDEFVWNDTSNVTKSPGATGGGISALFPLPAYQLGVGVPTQIKTGVAGRGIPDVAGNASPNSGYPLFVGGNFKGSAGGTSAVAPLYAGLIAIINSHLKDAGALYPVGFLNPTLYASKNVCRDVSGAAGPTNNTYGGVIGYPAGAGWDACTGWGSIDGTKLINTLRPLSVSIRQHRNGSCDPGAVAGTTLVFSAETVGGAGQLTYLWELTNAQVAPGGTKTDPSVPVLVPAAGTSFTVQVTVTDPFEGESVASVSLVSVDPAIAPIITVLCEFLHWSMEFQRPIYINPGDNGPFHPFTTSELQALHRFASQLANLSGSVLDRGLLPRNLGPLDA